MTSVNNAPKPPDYILDLLQAYEVEMQAIIKDLDTLKDVPSTIRNKASMLHLRITADIKNHNDKGRPEPPPLDHDL